MAVALFLSGGASNSRSDFSLGGERSIARARGLMFNPTPAQFAAGALLHRCVYVYSDVDCEVVAYIDSETPSEDTTIGLAWGAAAGEVEPSIADQTVLPRSDFAHPMSQVVALNGGTILAGEARPLWIQYQVKAGAAEEEREAFRLHLPHEEFRLAEIEGMVVEIEGKLMEIS